MNGVCCFCNTSFSVSKRSAEHILPQWLLKSAGISKKDSHFFEAVASDGTKKSRVTPVYSNTYKRVCSACNSGWLSQLENEAKRIMGQMTRGEEFVIGQVEGILLTAWFYKIFAPTHLTEGSPRADLIRAEDLASLHRHLHPEGPSYLAAARCTERRVAKINLHFFTSQFVTSKEEADRDSPAEAKCFVGMLRVSDLLFVFACVPPSGEWGLEIDPRLAESLQLWPRRDEIRFRRLSLPDISSPESLQFYFVHPGHNPPVKRKKKPGRCGTLPAAQNLL